MQSINTVDYHTAGEPFRIVADGLPPFPGDTVAERRLILLRQRDAPAEQVRKLLSSEPRGHADMYGGFIVPADDDGAHFGVLFWHKDGYSTACGHGTIALAAWAVDSGRVAAPDDGTVTVRIDVPSGRVSARVTRECGRTKSIVFRNVVSRVVERGVKAETVSFGTVQADVAYGGAYYACVASPVPVEPGRIDDLIKLGREVKKALPTFDLYGVILYEELGPGRQRNVTVFADGQVDRSPCGSGTSARLALIGGDRTLRHESIVGTVFHGRIVASTSAGVITEVSGSAYRTGEHTFFLDPDDDLGTGFQLR
jgi:proline racemase/trans-L-3-hydroxyproline dehydratase